MTPLVRLIVLYALVAVCFTILGAALGVSWASIRRLRRVDHGHGDVVRGVSRLSGHWYDVAVSGVGMGRRTATGA